MRLLFTTADRAFLAAVAGVLSRDRRRSFLVGPDTWRDGTEPLRREGACAARGGPVALRSIPRSSI